MGYMHGSSHQNPRPEDELQHRIEHQQSRHNEIDEKKFNGRVPAHNVIEATRTEATNYRQAPTNATAAAPAAAQEPVPEPRLLFPALPILSNAINALVIRHERYFIDKVSNAFAKTSEKHNYDNYVQYTFGSQRQLPDSFISSQQLGSSSTVAPNACSTIQPRSSCNINVNSNHNSKNKTTNNTSNDNNDNQHHQRRHEPSTQANGRSCKSFPHHKKPSIYITEPSLIPFGGGGSGGGGNGGGCIKNSICLYAVFSIFITLFYLTTPIAAYDTVNPM